MTTTLFSDRAKAAGGALDVTVAEVRDALRATSLGPGARTRYVGEVRVRYRVHHDPVYWHQSWAKAEVWDPADLAWHDLAELAPGLWAYGAPRADRQRAIDGEMTDAALKAMHGLADRAEKILGGGDV